MTQYSWPEDYLSREALTDEMGSLNWIPQSHEDFCKAVNQSRLRLGILGDMHKKLREIVPPKLFRNRQQQLIKAMYNDPRICIQIHQIGVDFVLDPFNE